MANTRKDYGDPLEAIGVRQPSGAINIDAFGLAQAQLTYALDSGSSNLTDAIDTVSMGFNYPDNIGFSMKSYKYSITLQPGGVAMMTVDFMGVSRGIGYTDAQITGVSNTSAQPIETHPNFTVITITEIPSVVPLGGKPEAPSTNKNKPIFVPSGSVTDPWRFDGFGLPADGTRNPKAGIRHYLRPMYNVRGMIVFNNDTGYKAARLTNSVGRVLQQPSDMYKLITPGDVLGALSPELCLITAANAECIGTPDNYAGIKVVYDIMIGGDLGWDLEIYGPAGGILS